MIEKLMTDKLKRHFKWTLVGIFCVFYFCFMLGVDGYISTRLDDIYPLGSGHNGSGFVYYLDLFLRGSFVVTFLMALVIPLIMALNAVIHLFRSIKETLIYCGFILLHIASFYVALFLFGNWLL